MCNYDLRDPVQARRRWLRACWRYATRKLALKPWEGHDPPTGQPVKLICGHEIPMTEEWEWDGPEYCHLCAQEGVDMWVQEYETTREMAYHKARSELWEARGWYDKALGIPSLGDMLFLDSDDE
jgi:hypothetical protein